MSTAEKESESKASSQARATVWLGAWNRPGGGRSGQFMGPRGDPSNPEAPPVAVTSHDLTLFSTGVRSPRVSCFRQIASDRRQETARRKRYLCILRERNSILTTLNKRSGHNYTSLYTMQETETHKHETHVTTSRKQIIITFLHITQVKS